MTKVLLATLIAFLSVASLSAQTVRDRNNMKIGTIENQGTIRDANNMKVGSIDNNGTVRDRNNMKIGSIGKDGTVRDRNPAPFRFSKRSNPSLRQPPPSSFNLSKNTFCHFLSAKLGYHTATYLRNQKKLSKKAKNVVLRK